MTFAARTLFGGAGGTGAGGYDGAEATAHISSGGVTVTVSFNRDGTVTVSSSPPGHTSESVGLPCSWILPTTVDIGDTHWVRATHVSGDTVGTGTVGSWVQLNTARTWGMHVNTFGAFKSGVYTFEIAIDSGGSTIIATGNITFLAETDT